MSDNNQVSLYDFENSAEIPASGESDPMALFRRAMIYCRQHPGTTLLIPPGEYILSDDLSKEIRQKVMTGEYGSNPQKVMFSPSFRYTRGIDIEGQRGTKILGHGVTLLVDGFMEPVSLRNCEDVSLYGITVDHKRKPYSKGQVMSAVQREDGRYNLNVKLEESCPVTEASPLQLRAVLYSANSGKYYPVSQREVRVLDSHNLLVAVDSDCIPETGERCIGMEYYTLHTLHARPAILIEACKNITLEDMTVHSQPGMGIVANRNENILIRRLSVVPSCGHHFSTNTDATHFTSTKGLLRLENCTFEGQGDDFINVHNYYHTLTPCGGDSCYMHTEAVDGTHSQSLDYPDEGDLLELTRKDTLSLYDTYQVVKCTPLPEEGRAWIQVDHSLPEPEQCSQYYFADITRLPRLEVIGCHAGNHFARGMLVRTRSALLEGNTISDVLGPAVFIAAETWWSEGVTAQNITVRRNRITNTRPVEGEAGGIVVKIECADPRDCPMKNIVIEDNIIDCPRAEHGIYVRNTDGLTLKRNHTVSQGEPCVITNCRNVYSE